MAMQHTKKENAAPRAGGSGVRSKQSWNGAVVAHSTGFVNPAAVLSTVSLRNGRHDPNINIVI
jgi:hypothetical protein